MQNKAALDHSKLLSAVSVLAVAHPDLPVWLSSAA